MKECRVQSGSRPFDGIGNAKIETGVLTETVAVVAQCGISSRFERDLVASGARIASVGPLIARMACSQRGSGVCILFLVEERVAFLELLNEDLQVVHGARLDILRARSPSTL